MYRHSQLVKYFSGLVITSFFSTAPVALLAPSVNISLPKTNSTMFEANLKQCSSQIKKKAKSSPADVVGKIDKAGQDIAKTSEPVESETTKKNSESKEDSDKKVIPLKNEPNAKKKSTSNERRYKFDIREGFSGIVRKTKGAVVNITISQLLDSKKIGEEFSQLGPDGGPLGEFFKEFFKNGTPGGASPKPRRVSSLGSGFFISVGEKSALLVTNYHVVDGADKITVLMDDGTEVKAELKAHDKVTDLAVVEIKYGRRKEIKEKIKVLSWADSDSVQVGDWVVAIGNPFGLGGTVTNGIISARTRELPGKMGYSELLQHSASINPGSSGGPIVDMDGKIVGVNRLILTPSGGSVGVGFAVPANIAKRVIDQLVQYGKTKSGWIGVTIQDVNKPMAETFGWKEERGAIVSRVTKDGPAEKAGLKSGDVIIKFAGSDINKKNRLKRVVRGTEPASTVEVIVWRRQPGGKGAEVKLSLKVGEFEDANEKGLIKLPGQDDKSSLKPDKIKTVKVLGMELAEITGELRKTYKIAPSTSGVIVVDVDPNSEAATIGIERGFVIAEAGQAKVTKPDDVAAAVNKIRKGGGSEYIMLMIVKDGDNIYITLNIDAEDDFDNNKDKNQKDSKNKAYKSQKRKKAANRNR